MTEKLNIQTSVTAKGETGYMKKISQPKASANKRSDRRKKTVSPTNTSDIETSTSPVPKQQFMPFN